MVTIRKKKIESAEEKEARLQKEKEAAMGLQDEYQAKGFELVTWVQENKGIVSVTIATVLLACVVFSAYVFYQKRASTLSSMTYMEAVKLLEESESKTGEEKAKDVQQAQETLKLIGSKGSSGVTVLANIKAAHLALEKNEVKDAISLYEKALSKINKSDDLYPVVMIGLAYAYKADNQSEKALANFKELIAIKDSAVEEAALFEAAQLLVDKKEIDEAIRLLGLLTEKFPSSVYANDAKRLRESLD